MNTDTTPTRRSGRPPGSKKRPLQPQWEIYGNNEGHSFRRRGPLVSVEVMSFAFGYLVTLGYMGLRKTRQRLILRSERVEGIVRDARRRMNRRRW